MAPTAHQLLPKVWRVARFAFEKASRALWARLPETGQPSHLKLQPVYAHIKHRQPINRAAAIRQGQSRYLSTLRASSRRLVASTIPSSKIGTAVNRLTTRTPFATTLRPNLTGGTLCRTAGGYSIGAGRIGGARYFSNSPACPAQVVQNVSAAVRAFWLSGQRARFDGIDKKTGRKQYKTVTALQAEASRKMADTPCSAAGSYVDFKVSPTITAFGCLKEMQLSSTSSFNCEQITLNTPSLMDLLSGDLARALKDFVAVVNDLKKLSTLGDLPVALHDQSTIRIRFPGCDAESVERLCIEVGVQRGIIHQDADFESRNGAQMALLFPFAPSHHESESELFSFYDPPAVSPDKLDWREMMLSEKTQRSTSTNWKDYQYVSSAEQNPWARSLSGYESMDISDLGDRAFFPDIPEVTTPSKGSDFGGFEGIYKFLEECDRARR
ncbi:hypothetical protein LOZ61_002690 [Ophidiomyces ophidiicola]|nr:hypothetical protein LOZ61_002690 [Ophidiomyces ophidiicola]KAI1930274.1 hypothetical protein LOZ60_001057 [Ophidiomyces ophidiicola]KAI1968115.1 hypothetical protein LOZ59_000476 [Ophidiomyces ophidiicola]KAI1975584.1 hypothetical protein LOZ56_000492 [Ophidiomyces ophidiicola]KAI2004988.1 hypothetical protein LOZ49_005610 [Ophidiomyces ophidiicola]